ncbi:MAG: hypothetical protein ACXVEF_14660 [Polyangiales bacterium]
MKRSVFLFAFVVGCSGSAFETAPSTDDSAVDSSVSDSEIDSTVDSTIEDSSTTDTGTAADSSTTDTSTDTGSDGDSGTTDSGTDSNLADSGSPTDSGVVEVGLPDVMGGCPAPVSTETPKDVSSMTCDDLKTAYPAAVNSAKACGCEADCSQEVPKDFCNCPTIVSPSAPGYTSLEPMRQRWKDLHCTIICPLIACKTAVLAGCFPASGSSGPTVCTLK